jgi:cytochrome c oxidase assembly protein subunit 15
VAALRPSSRLVTRLCLAAVVANAVIVVTGALVRLTGSGLGCPTWPRCTPASYVTTRESGVHGLIEFGNRTLTFVLSAIVIACIVATLRQRPRRRPLVILSWLLLAGILAQAVLGGITVLTGLNPWSVMAHFLLSMVLLANAVVLHHRAGQPAGPTRPAVGGDLLALGRLEVAVAALVVFLGTIVTSSGPHGGDEHAERLPFLLPDITRLHGIAVALFLAVTLVTLLRLRRAGVHRRILRRSEALLAVLVAQAAVGYVQYFTGVPALLVGFHVAGAAAVWVAVLRLHLAFSVPVARPGTDADGGSVEPWTVALSSR